MIHLRSWNLHSEEGFCAPILSKAVLLVSLFIFLLLEIPLLAQDFNFTLVEDTFGLQSNDQYIFPELLDLDNDGDLDMFTGGQFSPFSNIYDRYKYYENIGTPSEPDFSSEPIIDPFGITHVGDYNSLSHGDIDNDGDFDIITTDDVLGDLPTDETTIRFYENIGTAEEPLFASPVNNPFGFTTEGFFFSNIEMLDLDSDGDLDFLQVLIKHIPNSFGEEYFLYYIQNISEGDSLQFAEPILLISSLTISIGSYCVNSGDFDFDGDPDILLGTVGSADLLYIENLTEPGGVLNIADPLVNPFGLPSSYNYVAIDVVDIDNDGDQDLVRHTAQSFFGEDHLFEFYINEDNRNLPPTSENLTITVYEDSLYNFTEISFPFDDLNGIDELSGVVITSLPTNGELKLDALLLDENFPLEISDLPNLSYLSDENLYGTALDSLRFKVYDGEVFSELSYKILIDVLPTNDAPSLSLSSEAICPDWNDLSFHLTDFGDIDGDELSFSMSSDDPLIESGGILYVGGDSALLIFNPIEEAEGIASIPINLSDGFETVSKTINIDFSCSINNVGLNNSIEKEAISMYPNPASEKVYLIWQKVSSAKSRIELFDLQSRKIMEVEVWQGNKTILDVSDLAKGQYFVKWTSGQQVATRKLLVK